MVIQIFDWKDAEVASNFTVRFQCSSFQDGFDVVVHVSMVTLIMIMTMEWRWEGLWGKLKAEREQIFTLLQVNPISCQRCILKPLLESGVARIFHSGGGGGGVREGAHWSALHIDLIWI